MLIMAIMYTHNKKGVHGEVLYTSVAEIHLYYKYLQLYRYYVFINIHFGHLKKYK